MNVQIRQANADDLPAIYELVAELARYVGQTDAFTATQDDYASDFAAGFFHAIVAEETGRGVVGMALYYFSYSTWKGRMIYLEDFVLHPDYRRRGIGHRLWEVLKERGRERQCRLLKWQIARENTEALKFYAAQEAIISDDWLNGNVYL